ncbi:MAG: hypothetical protein KBS59_00620, partial [Clostridiales bacterium]|nr:hypothetical protein [Clostridiales bacterium]
DYTRDPQGFDFALLCDEARSYLENSGALYGTPIERLKKMNIRAVELYGSHGIDLEKDMVEIAVCAQHNNGGLAVDKNYESTTLRNFYPVGECAGVFGVRRPGGSALNSTQVSSMRAAEHIAKTLSDFSFAELSSTVTDEIENALEDLLAVSCGDADMDFIVSKRLEYGKIMSDCGAFKREMNSVLRAIEYYGNEIENFKITYSVAPEYASQAMINRDILITSYTYLCAIRDYISDGGLSRGSYIIERDGGVFPPEIDKAHFDKVQYTLYDGKSSKSRFEARRKIPQSEQWFEKVYNK